MLDRKGGRHAVLKGQSESLPIYTTQWLKILLKFLQVQGSKYDTDGLKGLLKNLVESKSLLVVVNTLPVYIYAQVYF